MIQSECMRFAARACFLFVSLCLVLEAKVPLTHETMWTMPRVGAPSPSPDGKWVVFPVTEPAYDSKDQVIDLWIVPSDGSAKPRRLTFSKGGESGVDWSPDSRKIAFSAKREGDTESQIYVLDVASGGEAIRVSSWSMGASSPKWSPDGEKLLFQSMVYPGAADDEANKKISEERKARKYNAYVYDGFPIRYWDRWLDDKRPTLLVQAAEPGSPARNLLAGTKLAASPGFDGASTTSGSTLQPVWAPDGKSIVFTATTERNAAAYSLVSTHLYRVAADGGEPEAITSGKDSYSVPMFRPDGKALYAQVERRGPKVYSHTRLAMWTWPNPGQPKWVSPGWDRSVGDVAFSPDSRTVYLTAEDAGLIRLFHVPADGGETRPVLEMTRGGYTNLASAEKASNLLLVANFDSAVNPHEVVRIEPGAGRHVNLSEFNVAKAAEIDWQPPEHFWFTSKGGRRIHNLLILPPGFDRAKKYPLVVFMHGGPHSMSRDNFHTRWNYHLLAAPGYVVLTTNYKGSTGFSEEFAQAIQGDPLKGPCEEILEAVDVALKRYPFIDGSRMAAGGASYGGHLANWLQATTTRFKALYSHAGLINLESQWGTSDVIYHRELNNGGPVWEQGPVWREQNPIRYAANYKTPILLTVGEKDYRVPVNQTIENWSVLQRLRIPSRLVVFPDENHWIVKGENNRFFFQTLHEWLGRHLAD
jgi:dipeptidyl aminopeptidase/acylaminoacyl peptidase